MSESLGERIRLYRTARGYTQREVAERLGITAQAVSKWESGGSCPDVMLLYDLARLLGVTTDCLLCPETENGEAAPEEAAAESAG